MLSTYLYQYSYFRNVFSAFVNIVICKFVNIVCLFFVCVENVKAVIGVGKYATNYMFSVSAFFITTFMPSTYLYDEYNIVTFYLILCLPYIVTF